MKYRFVYKDGGWWLMIKTLDELTEYNEKTLSSNQIMKGFQSLLTKPEDCHYERNEYLIYLSALNNKTDIVSTTVNLMEKQLKVQINEILKGKNLYFNHVGGWHSGNDDFDQWVDSDKLIFPNLQKEQIKIEQFPNGEHFYAYIGNVQIRDRDTLKWNTYEEAYNKALEYVNNK